MTITFMILFTAAVVIAAALILILIANLNRQKKTGKKNIYKSENVSLQNQYKRSTGIQQPRTAA